MIFLPKTLQSPQKLETYQNLNLTNFRRTSFLDDINVANAIFIR